MLAELAIDDLVLIVEARLQFGAGLNVITGETGAGKSLLAQAIGLLMGQRASDDLVRTGAERALVQALFEDDEGSVAVAREVPLGGRSRARVDGLLSSASVIESILAQRVAFYGQLEHTRLLQLGEQLRFFDALAGAAVTAAGDDYRRAYGAAQTANSAAAEVAGDEHQRQRDLDQLRFEVAEIEAAALQPGEDESLADERRRLRSAERLLERVGGAFALLGGEGDEPTGVSAVRSAERLLAEAADLDPRLLAHAERLGKLHGELDDSAQQLRDYLEQLDLDAARRDQIEQRWDQLRGLMRKYGESADAVLAYGAEAAARLLRLEAATGDATALAAAADEARAAALGAAKRLHEARVAAAADVAALVTEELRRLAMPEARFVVDVVARGAEWPALSTRGGDEVEFSFSANPGVPLRPLRDVASGGELARIMLALRSIVPLGDEVETLIFDEIDQGIGGFTASAVGERLAQLAGQRQVLCITHLPQVAAFAERHFAIAKAASGGETETSVREVAGEARLAELCRMLGADLDDRGAREHAEALLARAAAR